MPPVRLGAVGYLNARPLVYGLGTSLRFNLRFDVPARCADLLHAGEIHVGLIPSIEYLRGPEAYYIVPDLAIASHGPVASVAIFTTRPMNDVRSIAMDTTSRASVALARVLCAREFRIHPRLVPHGPNLASMLADCDAALIIGDSTLFEETAVEKIDLGETWTKATGLPFVYAFWAGRVDALSPEDARVLQAARDEGVTHSEEIAREYFVDAPERQPAGARYLRDNIRYHMGADEQAGLELFYRYAVEVGVVPASDALRFYGEGGPGKS